MRSKDKGEAIMDRYPDHRKQLEMVVVEDLVSGNFDKAVKGCQGVIHTASPFTYKVEDNERDLLKVSSY